MLFLSSSHSHAVSFLDLYETCNWKNKGFTNRIIREAYQYCPLDEKDDLSQCAKHKPSMVPFCQNISCKPNILTELKDIKKAVFTEYTLSNQIPKECFFASQALGVNLWPAEKYTYYYCHSSQSNHTLPKMEFYNCKSQVENCKLKTQETPQAAGVRLANRPPCLNHQYIHLISRAFNQITDCFGFTLKKEKERLFALFHHESRFLLNKVEEYDEDGKIRESTNRCFGQMKNDFISNVNRYIYFGDRDREKDKDKNKPRVSRWYKYGDIYKKAKMACPFLEQTLTPRPVYLTDTTIHPNNTFEKTHVNKKQVMICKTSQDPYSCLFYSVYNAKVNLVFMFDNLSKTDKTTIHPSWQARLKQKMPQSTKYNEMLLITGTARSPEGKRILWRRFLRDSSSPNITPENSQIKKVSLFKNEDELIWAFILYAHNGGGTVVTIRFSEFMDKLKEDITDPDCKKDAVCNRYRTSVLRGRGLSTSVLHKEFAKYAEEKQIENHEELSQFMEKINRDMAYFSGSEGALRRAVVRLHTREGKAAPGRESINQFLNDVKKHCPTSLN